jgi:hypothetical protein
MTYVGDGNQRDTPGGAEVGVTKLIAQILHLVGRELDRKSRHQKNEVIRSWNDSRRSRPPTRCCNRHQGAGLSYMKRLTSEWGERCPAVQHALARRSQTRIFQPANVSCAESI